MRPKSSELFNQIENPSQGLLGSVVGENKQPDQDEPEDETVLQQLREQHLDSKID